MKKNNSYLDISRNKKNILYKNNDNSNNEIYINNIKCIDYTTKLNQKINIKHNSENTNIKIKNIMNNLKKNRKENNNSLKLLNDIIDKRQKNKDILLLKNNSENDDINLKRLINNINLEYNNNNDRKNLFDNKKYLLDIKNNRTVNHFKFNNNDKYKNNYYSFLQQEKLPPIQRKLPAIIKTKVNINVEINGLDDLIQLIQDYPIKYDVEYNIDMQSIHYIKQPLLQLQKMVGMKQLKNSIVDQIIYFTQKLHISKNVKNNDFLHTVIYGPPRTGKTETAKILGNIFSKLGVLSKTKFKKVTRSDLIAGYLGQTALKTRDVVNESLGGVLFIDEA